MFFVFLSSETDLIVTLRAVMYKSGFAQCIYESITHLWEMTNFTSKIPKIFSRIWNNVEFWVT
jgi:hypothetical protein